MMLTLGIYYHCYISAAYVTRLNGDLPLVSLPVSSEAYTFPWSSLDLGLSVDSAVSTISSYIASEPQAGLP